MNKYSSSIIICSLPFDINCLYSLSVIVQLSVPTTVHRQQHMKFSEHEPCFISTTLTIYTHPKAIPSLSAEVNESFMPSWVAMCTGIRRQRSHVEAVGKHLQFSSHPWTKESCSSWPKPRAGISGVPDINCKRCPKLVPAIPKKKDKDKNKICAQFAALWPFDTSYL